MKSKWIAGLCSEQLRIVCDQGAETAHEISVATGRSICVINRIGRLKIEAGEWEKVWKRVNGRLLPAYRPRAH